MNANDELLVTQELRKTGIPANVRGFEYLRTAILITLEDKNILYNMNTKLYPKIAKKYEKTPSQVERSIRYATGVAWKNNNFKVIKGLFENSTEISRKKPTNQEFIAIFADNINLNRKRKII